jgi:hypothetical protein
MVQPTDVSRPRDVGFTPNTDIGRRPSQDSIRCNAASRSFEYNRCKTRATLPLDAIRRPRKTPIWKLEAALKC